MARKDQKNGCFQWVVTLGRSVNERWAKSWNRFVERFRRSNPTVHTLDLVNETGTPDLVLSKRAVSPRVDAVDVQHEALLARADAKLVKAIETQDLSEVQQKDVDLVVHAVNLAESNPRLTSAASDHGVHGHDQGMREFAANYVNVIVKGSQAKLQAEARATSPTQSAISDYAEQYAVKIIHQEKAKLEDETRTRSQESISSSIADEIADMVVRESLTSIVADTNLDVNTHIAAATGIAKDTDTGANRNQSATRRPKTVGEVMASLGFGSLEEDNGLPRVDI